MEIIWIYNCLICVYNKPQAVGGFLMVMTSTGKVLYITEAVDQFFGHSQVIIINLGYERAGGFLSNILCEIVESDGKFSITIFFCNAGCMLPSLLTNYTSTHLRTYIYRTCIGKWVHFLRAYNFFVFFRYIWKVKIENATVAWTLVGWMDLHQANNYNEQTSAYMQSLLVRLLLSFALSHIFT